MVMLEIVRRDLLRLLRSPGRTALSFAIPLFLATILALVFGGDGGQAIRVRVLVFDEDEGPLTGLLQGAAGEQPADGPSLELVQVGAEGYQMMDEGDPAAALLHVPARLSIDYLRGEPVTIEVVKNPSQRFLPQLVEEGAGTGATILSQASLLLRPELATVGAMIDSKAFPADTAIAGLGVAVNQKLRQLDTYLFPPLLTLEVSDESEQTEQSAADDSSAGALAILSYFLPGLSMMAVLFLAQIATRDIVRDRELGLLRQLLTAPVSAADYLTGKALSVVLVTGLGFLLMVGIGAAVGIDWGPPVAAGLLILAASIGVSGALLLLTSLVRSERQAGAITTIVILVWSMLGGCFVPLSQLPSFLLPLARTTLVYWCVDAFNIIMLGGGGLGDVLLHLAVLAGSGLVLLAIGIWVLGRKMAAGVL